jgi:1,4-dihydroxy-2-naphthoate octaprenyltransferase
MKVLPQITHFIIHLRWHYQLFILSGGFLMGGLFNGVIDWPEYLMQFTNVHLLLFGGATAYNSWHDKDTGPIGGLRHPPEMQPWMLPASWILQIAGAIFAWLSGTLFFGLYLFSVLFFWLYSAPGPRWKGHPIRSLFAIGLSTGTGSFLMGYAAAGADFISMHVFAASVGVALVMLSLYPVSQIYQMESDRIRGDITFAIRYGLPGVKRFFLMAFPAGTGILVLSFLIEGRTLLSVLFVLAGLIAGVTVWFFIRRLTGNEDEYATVMRIKYLTSFLFVLFIVICFLAL